MHWSHPIRIVRPMPIETLCAKPHNVLLLGDHNIRLVRVHSHLAGSCHLSSDSVRSRRWCEARARREEPARDSCVDEEQEIERPPVANERLGRQLEKQAKRLITLERQLWSNGIRQLPRSRDRRMVRPGGSGCVGVARRVDERSRGLAGDSGRRRGLVPIEPMERWVELMPDPRGICARRMYALHTA
jgi:hypothetical protein